MPIALGTEVEPQQRDMPRTFQVTQVQGTIAAGTAQMDGSGIVAEGAGRPGFQAGEAGDRSPQAVRR